MLATDAHSAARAGIDVALEPLDAHDLPPDLARVWRQLGGGDRLVAGRAAGTATWIVIAHAARSQFDDLQAAARADASLPDDLVAVALAGERFRGQRGRPWSALEGNLHLCRFARLDLAADAAQGAVSALPAVATAEAIDEGRGGDDAVHVKWVNDLLVAGRKVGGVISASGARGGRLGHALWGIGVNVEREPVVERDPRVPPVGSLARLAPRAADLPSLTQRVARRLDARIEQLRRGDHGALLAAYRDRSMVIGRRVALWPSSDDASADAPLHVGRVLALRDDLGLELDGWPQVVHGGRITLAEDA